MSFLCSEYVLESKYDLKNIGGDVEVFVKNITITAAKKEGAPAESAAAAGAAAARRRKRQHRLKCPAVFSEKKRRYQARCPLLFPFSQVFRYGKTDSGSYIRP